MGLRVMNKFSVLSCVNVGDLERDVNDAEAPIEFEYDKPLVVLSCVADPTFLLFFPISEENSKTIRYILSNQQYDSNTNILGIYRTMIDSWAAGDRNLSGIIFDSVYDKDRQDDILKIRLALCHNGMLDSLVNVNFVHAVLLSAIERVDIIISEELLSKLAPIGRGESSGQMDSFVPSEDEEDFYDEEMEEKWQREAYQNGKLEYNSDYPNDETLDTIVDHIFHLQVKDKESDKNSSTKNSSTNKKKDPFDTDEDPPEENDLF